MYWILSYNEDYFRMSDFFKQAEYIDFNFTNRFSFQIGDKVYLYASKPLARIQYEVEVCLIDVPYDDYKDDSDFGGTLYHSESEYKKSFHVRFRLIRELGSERLSYGNLIQHGLKGSIRGPIKASGELLTYIQNNLGEDNIDDSTLKTQSSVKFRLKDIIDLIAPPDCYLYNHYIPLFIQEAKSGKNWEDWEPDVFNNFFEKAKNGVAFLGNGQMTRADRASIKEHWMELAPHLKRIAGSQDVPLWQEYETIRKIVRKYTSTNKRVATNRMLANLQPFLLCTEVDLNKLNELMGYIQEYTSTIVPEYDKENWEKTSFAFQALIKAVIPNVNLFEYCYLPWKLLAFFRDGDFSGMMESLDYDELTNSEEIFEGAKKEIVVNAYERNPLARQKCIEAHGCICSVCGLDFEKKYGDIGRGFIHVHHIVPISTIGKEYIIDPVKDLVPVCPNCHAMIHKFNDVGLSTIIKLKSRLNLHQNS